MQHALLGAASQRYKKESLHFLCCISVFLNRQYDFDVVYCMSCMKEGRHFFFGHIEDVSCILSQEDSVSSIFLYTLNCENPSSRRISWTFIGPYLRGHKAPLKEGVGGALYKEVV